MRNTRHATIAEGEAQKQPRPAGPSARYLLLRQWRCHADVEPIGAEVVIEQAEAAVLFQVGEEPPALLFPDLPQIVRVGPATGLVLPQAREEATGIALAEQDPAV